MKTLLQDFIGKKMVGYIPPLSKREGGLSEQKHKATLLHLENLRGEDIANSVRVSHNLLRKWRTEKFFLATIENHYRDFIVLFIENLPEFKPELFADLPQYNPLLLGKIATTTMRLFSEDRKDSSLMLLIDFLLILKRYVPVGVIGDTVLGGTHKATMLGIVKKAKENILVKDYERASKFLDLLEKII